MALISIKKRLHPSSNEMAELFQRNKSTISRHISKIYEEGELSPTGTVSEFATVQMKGTRSVERKDNPTDARNPIDHDGREGIFYIHKREVVYYLIQALAV